MFKKILIAAAAMSIAFVAVEAQAKPQQPNKQWKNPGPKINKGPHWVHHNHYKPVIVVGRPVVRPVVYERPVRAVADMCNCLTKDYTPEGTVVFKDLCTKEMAAAPVEGADIKTGDAAPANNNFAGRSYQDYLAANKQQPTN